MKYTNPLGSIDRSTAAIKVTGDVPQRFRDAAAKYKKHCVTTTHPQDFDPVLDPTLPRIGPWLRCGDDVLLDFVGGVATRVLGCHHPKVEEMLERCHRYGLTEWKDAGTDFYYSNTVDLPMTHDLAEAVLRRTNEEFGGDYMMFPINTGAEAVSNCVKIACWNKYLKLKESLGDARFASLMEQMGIEADPFFPGLYLDYPFFGFAFAGAFHGRTMDVLSLTKSKPVHKEGYPQIRWVRHFKYDTQEFEAAVDPTPLAQLIDERRVADVVFKRKLVPAGLLCYVIIEPVQGEGGYRIPSAAFVQAVAAFAKKTGAYLIDDEVQAGMGRTGKLWAMGHFGVAPDCISAAKALLTGASIVRRELATRIPPGKISSTWGGGDLIRICQAYAVLDAMFSYRDPDIGNRTPIENAPAMGEYFVAKLNDLKKRYPKYVKSVRGLGLMVALSTPDTKTRDKIEEIVWRKGLIILGCGVDSLRFLAPLDVRPREIDACVAVLEAALKEMPA